MIYTLPAHFPPGGCHVAELCFMAHFISAQRSQLRAWLTSPDAEVKLHSADSARNLQEQLDRVLQAVAATNECRDNLEQVISVASEIRSLLSAFNLHKRLHTCPAGKERWPRDNLKRMEKHFPSGLLPPQLPSEYVHPQHVASFMIGEDGSVGDFLTEKEDWLGHGYFYYPCPSQWDGTIANSGDGGDANTNFDVLEEKFVRLRKAKVMCADYNLLRRDFKDALVSLSDAEIDRWLLENVAFISQGQVARISEGGDHHALLGIGSEGNAIQDLLDDSQCKMGLRMRAGGRAATLFAGDHYSFSDEGFLVANLVDVKGCGTHANVACKKVSHTGFLGKTDALRDLAVQRLIQRICELEGEQDAWGTVRFYGIIDSGLKYRSDIADPATGVMGDSCVLALRQAQSRLAADFPGVGDFAAGGGNLLLAGDPNVLLGTGVGRRVREVLERYRFSGEIAASSFDIDLAKSRDSQDHLDDVTSQWNLQADASLSHFLDFSDTFVFPGSCLHGDWHLLADTVLAGYVLGHNSTSYTLDAILGLAIGTTTPIDAKPERVGPGNPIMMQNLFGTLDQGVAYEKFSQEWRRFSKSKMHRKEAGKITLDGTIKADVCDGEGDEGFIVRGDRTKSCQNWFMGVDVMTGPIWKWAEHPTRWREAPILDVIERWLPTARASSSREKRCRSPSS